MSNTIVYPSFKEAQQLYAQYSPLENTSMLYSRLSNLIDKSFLSIIENQNIHAIYNNIIMRYYPNEICIKSSFIKQILVKNKQQVTIFELPIGSSRADLCKINGKSVAFEIKTDLDNFSRLNKQINDYYKVFEEVYVICSESNISNIVLELPESCGLYSYKQNKHGQYKFKLIRKATLNGSFDITKQLQLVRKEEFYTYFKIDKNILSKNKLIESTAKTYTPNQINHVFKTILKHRFEKQWNFFTQYYEDMYEINYQWFYKTQIIPSRIYNTLCDSYTHT